MRVSLWLASYRQPVHFRPFGWPHGQREACGLAGGLIAALNAPPPSIEMAVMGTGAWATRLAVAWVAEEIDTRDPAIEDRIATDDHRAQTRAIGRVVSHHRFLLLPGVRVRKLAAA